VHQVYYRDVHRHSIAAMAAVVQQAAEEGDAVAADILERAGAELASAASSVIARLGMRGEAFPIVLAGGIFKGIPWLVRDVIRRLGDIAPRSAIQVLAVEPAVGAVRLAIAAARGELRLPRYVQG
jgi:N-acetylglucosamine kinase-like BadF-type ATPase